MIPPPRRRGRSAIYRETHLRAIRKLRALNQRGVTLRAAGQLLRNQGGSRDLKRSLLSELQLVEGEATYSRAELADASGIPDYLIRAAEQEQLLAPQIVGGEARYRDADLQALQAGAQLLAAGVPLQSLWSLAQDHSSHVESITQRAIDLFDQHLASGEESATSQRDPDTLRQAFRELLPAVTKLVALHFEST